MMFLLSLKEDGLSTSASKAVRLIAPAWKETGGKGNGKPENGLFCSRKIWGKGELR